MNEETVVVRNGVTVRKSFSADEFPVPAVTFDVASTRDEAVELRFTDTIPDGFGVEQIGFHPDYGSEHWTATGDGGVRFERSVEPGEEFVTVYGVRMDADDEPTVFLEKPTVEVNPAEAAETADVVPEESSEVVRELARGERETVPGLEADDSNEEAELAEAGTTPTDARAEPGEDAPEPEAAEPEPSEAEPEPSDPVDDPPETPESEGESAPTALDAVSDPDQETQVMESDLDESDAVRDATEADATSQSAESEMTDPVTGVDDSDTAVTPGESTATNESPMEDTMPSETDTESIVAAFAAEIEAGTIDDADLSVIRDALETEPPSDRIRLEHLQSRVSDLEAYTDALERFLDEEGGGEEILHELEAEIGSFEEELAAVQARLDAAATERDTMSEHLENLENTVEAIAGVAEQIERVRDDVEAIDERLIDVEGVAAEVSELETELDSVRDDLSDMTEWRDQLSDVFGP